MHNFSNSFVTTLLVVNTIHPSDCQPAIKRKPQHAPKNLF